MTAIATTSATNKSTSASTAVHGARAVRTLAWQAAVLDTAAVHDGLNRLWTELSGDTAQLRTAEDADSDTDADAAKPVAGVEGLVRANTLNLIAVARSRSEAERIEHAVAHLTQLYPSRVVIFVARADDAAPEVDLDVRLAILEQPQQRDRAAVRFECITVEADPDRAAQLASAASPLLVAELPDVLWWPGDALDGPLFDDLLAIIDRLIVDSATFTKPATGLRTLAALLSQPSGCPITNDFAWDRLAPWRHLIAQFFDPASVRASLDAIDEITIRYAGARPDGSSGFTSALLAIGWLATRLGWTSPEPLTRLRDGWWGTLRAADRSTGKRRELILRLHPVAEPTVLDCLASIHLTARGSAPGTFSVEQADAGLTTTSETPTMPRVSRMVHARPRDDTALLGNELRAFSRDRVFEESLRFAAALVPITNTKGGN